MYLQKARNTALIITCALLHYSTFNAPQIQEIKTEIKGMRWKPWLTNPQEQPVCFESSQNWELEKRNIGNKTNKTPNTTPLTPQQTTRNSGAGLHTMMEGSSAGRAGQLPGKAGTHTASHGAAGRRVKRNCRKKDQASERRQTARLTDFCTID